MSDHSFAYALHSDEECERLEFQARIANIERHLRHLPIAPDDRVLDAGCGSGSMARLIARSFPGAEIVGVDMRQQYLDFAAARARGEGLDNLTFRQADVFALPFADASFDVVWAKYLMQWMKDLRLPLAEIRRVTRPGGLVVSCDLDGIFVDHFPIAAEFERQVREVMAALADCDVGRKVAPAMLGLGFEDVGVEIETDTVFTVIGSIDPQRRWNCEKIWRSAGPQIGQVLGSQPAAEVFIDRLLTHYDDPATCSFTSLYFTRGRVSGG